MNPADLKARVEALVKALGRSDFATAKAKIDELRADLPGGALDAASELRLAEAALERAYAKGKAADIRAARTLRDEVARRARDEAASKRPARRSREKPAPTDAEERPQDGPGPKSIRIQRAMLAHIVLGHTEEEAIAAVSGKAGLMWQDEAVRCSRERAEAELLALGRVLQLRHDDPAFHERLIGSTSEALQRIARRAEEHGQYAAAREALMARVRLHSVRSERFSRLAPGREDADATLAVTADEDAHTRTAREFANLTDEELDERARKLSARSAIFGGNREQG